MDAHTLVQRASVANTDDFIGLSTETQEILSREQNSPNVTGKLVKLPAAGEFVVVGDLHGDIENLESILEKTQFLNKAQEEKNICLIFLGDYGDRGKNSPEVLYLILEIKKKWPSKVILLRGNHESTKEPLPFPHDLPEQLNEKYGPKDGQRIYSAVQKLFEQLYLCAIVQGLFILMHGGPPSDLKSLDDIAYADQAGTAALEEILWSDPEESLKGSKPSPRGAGKLFGADITERLLKVAGVEWLIRGHEPSVNGYKFNHGGRVLTIFSTNKPPYRNRSACYFHVDLSKKIGSLNIEQCVQHL